MGRPYKCPYCKSTRTHWKGCRIRAKDKVRLRHCNNCQRKFTTGAIIPKKKRKHK